MSSPSKKAVSSKNSRNSLEYTPSVISPRSIKRLKEKVVSTDDRQGNPKAKPRGEFPRKELISTISNILKMSELEPHSYKFPQFKEMKLISKSINTYLGELGDSKGDDNLGVYGTPVFVVTTKALLDQLCKLGFYKMMLPAIWEAEHNIYEAIYKLWDKAIFLFIEFLNDPNSDDIMYCYGELAASVIAYLSTVILDRMNDLYNFLNDPKMPIQEKREKLLERSKLIERNLEHVSLLIFENRTSLSNLPAISGNSSVSPRLENFIASRKRLGSPRKSRTRKSDSQSHSSHITRSTTEYKVISEGSTSTTTFDDIIEIDLNLNLDLIEDSLETEDATESSKQSAISIKHAKSAAPPRKRPSSITKSNWTLIPNLPLNSTTSGSSSPATTPRRLCDALVSPRLGSETDHVPRRSTPREKPNTQHVENDSPQKKTFLSNSNPTISPPPPSYIPIPPHSTSHTFISTTPSVSIRPSRRNIAHHSPRTPRDLMSKLESEVASLKKNFDTFKRFAEQKVTTDEQLSTIMALQKDELQYVTNTLAEKNTATLPIMTNNPRKFPTRTIDTDLTILSSLLVPSIIAPTDKFVIPEPTRALQEPRLEIIEDIYHDDFYDNSHYNFIGMKAESCHFVLSVLATPLLTCPELINMLDLGSSFKALLTWKKGTKVFTFSVPQLKNKNFVKVVEKLLEKKLLPGFDIYPVTQKNFPSDLLLLEQNHRQRILSFKVAVLYALPGQTELRQIFANKPEPDGRFYQWLDKTASKINLKGWTNYKGDFGDTDRDTYYTVWHGIEVIFHIAPFLEHEEHRRLIGNDICFIIFNDSQEVSFDSNVLDSLGTVPQFFSVIQPNGTDFYRLGFFQRSNLKSFDPPCPPTDHIFDSGGLKEYLFTKLHNALVMAKRCPPMNRLFTEPRSATLNELARKYPKDKQKAEKQEKKKEKKKIANDLDSILKVNIITTKNVKSTDNTLMSQSRSFCTVDFAGVSSRTPIVSNMDKWNVSFDYDLSLLHNKEDEKLGITVWKWNQESEHGILGKMHIKIKEITTLNTPQWFPLTGPTNASNGYIQLRFSLTSFDMY